MSLNVTIITVHKLTAEEQPILTLNKKKYCPKELIKFLSISCKFLPLETN